MAYNGSGSFTPSASYFPVVSGALIESAKFNGTVNDIATGLSTAITKDGQTTITGNLPMSGYRHTGVADGTARNDYASLGQVQDAAVSWGGTAAGTANAITLTLTPAITAYSTGMEVRYKSSASANTTAMTVAINGLATKAIQKNGSALASGDHPANSWFRITYDGTAFQLEKLELASDSVTASLALKANVASPTFTGTVTTPTLAVTGAATVGTTLGVTGAATLSSTLGVTGAVTLSSTLGVTGKITPSQTNGIVGTTTNNDAVAGSVGEYISSSVLAASAVALVTATDKTVTSISLTAGDWDVTGMGGFLISTATGVTGLFGGTSLTNNVAEVPTFSHRCASFNPAGEATYVIPDRRLSLSSTTTVYLVVNVLFSGGTAKGYGNIQARRVR